MLAQPILVSILLQGFSAKRQTQREADDRLVFSKMLALDLGSAVELAEGPSELLHLGRLADYYQINIESP